MSSHQILVLNSIIFFISLLYHIKKKTFGKIGVFVIGLYAFSSVFSIIYYDSLFSNYRNITLFPVIYFFILFHIICFPIIKFDKLKNIQFKYNINIIYYIGIICLFFSILPLIELLKKMPTLLGGNLAENFSKIHDARGEMEIASHRFKFSIVGAFMYRFVLIFYEISFLLIFPLIKARRFISLGGLGVVLVIIVKNLFYFVNASRSSLVWAILFFILSFYIFRSIFDIRLYKKIIKIGVVMVTTLASLFLIITISRLTVYQSNSGGEYTLIQFLSRYIGEGFLNFNEYCFDLKSHLNGKYCFHSIRDLFGLSTISWKFHDLLSLRNVLGAPMRVFYTFLGFFIFDLGLLGTFLWWSFLSFYFYKIIVKSKMPFSNLILLFLYIKIIVGGTTIYMYSGPASLYVLVLVAMSVLLKFLKM